MLHLKVKAVQAPGEGENTGGSGRREAANLPDLQHTAVGPEQVLLVLGVRPVGHDGQQRVCSDQAVQAPHIPQVRQTGSSRYPLHPDVRLTLDRDQTCPLSFLCGKETLVYAYGINT